MSKIIQKIKQTFGAAADDTSVWQNTQETKYVTLGKLYAANPYDPNDPVNHLEMKIAFDPDKQIYREYNHRFDDNVSNRKDWAVSAAKNPQSEIFSVREVYTTHIVKGQGEEREYIPCNQDKWAQWGVSTPEDVWKLDIH